MSLNARCSSTLGVLACRANSAPGNSIALMGGFAEVDSDDVTVLVNSG